VASCLYEHALFCVDQNDCEVHGMDCDELVTKINEYLANKANA